MIDYAVRLTRRPLGADTLLPGLRALGFRDGALLDICQVAAYYNYVNRLADGLGVEIETSVAGDGLLVTRAEFDQWRAHRAPKRNAG